MRDDCERDDNLVDREHETRKLTPKGWLVCDLVFRCGVPVDQADQMWDRFDAFISKQVRRECPDAAFGCVVMDGGGGYVIGLDEKWVD